jgi:hypothetical protein
MKEMTLDRSMPHFFAEKTRYQARKACPWAVVTMKVEGGYMGFTSAWRRRIWKHQKCANLLEPRAS